MAGPAHKPPQRSPALAHILGTKPHSCGLSPSLQTETPKGSGAVVGGVLPFIASFWGLRATWASVHITAISAPEPTGLAFLCMSLRVLFCLSYEDTSHRI